MSSSPSQGEQNHHGDVTHWVYVGGEEQFTFSDLQIATDVLTEAQDLLASLGRQRDSALTNQRP